MLATSAATQRSLRSRFHQSLLNLSRPSSIRQKHYGLQQVLLQNKALRMKRKKGAEIENVLVEGLLNSPKRSVKNDKKLWTDVLNAFKSDEKHLGAVTQMVRLVAGSKFYMNNDAVVARINLKYGRTLVKAQEVHRLAVKLGLLQEIGPHKSRLGPNAFILLQEPLDANDKVLEFQNETPKLSGEVLKLYDTFLPSGKAKLTRADVISRVQKTVRSAMRDKQLIAFPFGSYHTGLYTDQSDLDICISYPSNRRNQTPKYTSIRRIADALVPLSLRDSLTFVPKARVPIVKFTDRYANVKVDVNLHCTIGMANSDLIRQYVDIDPRVRPLIILVKLWAFSRLINEGWGGSLSSYSFILMVLHFLQNLKQPVVPCLQTEGEQKTFYHFDRDHDDVEPVRIKYCDSPKWFQRTNEMTLPQLFALFFGYYAGRLSEEQKKLFKFNTDFDLTENYIDITWIGPKDRDNLKYYADAPIVIRDPFLERNCGGTCHPLFADVIYNEICRAWRLLANGGSFSDVLRFTRR